MSLDYASWFLLLRNQSIDTSPLQDQCLLLVGASAYPHLIRRPL